MAVAATRGLMGAARSTVLPPDREGQDMDDGPQACDTNWGGFTDSSWGIADTRQD
ncbi:hypothetical protein [Kitasatospora sp. NPDC059571]|uniref:hypothetical protein n=1 Tax=Kitasatospora sp. NPDC059571 TaxID=3346871 RepID=UPI003683B529